MTDAELERTLANIHRTLELVAFLLAVLVVQNGGSLGVVGGAAAVLLSANALRNLVGNDDK